MSEPGEARAREGSPAESPHKGIIVWVCIAALLIAAFFSAVGALDRDVYGPRGLVHAYLGDLAAHNVEAALSLPGADLSAPGLAAAGIPVTASRELLRASVLDTISGVTITEDTDLGNNTHRVSAGYRLGSSQRTSTFLLRRTGSYLGLFGSWRFAASPLAVVQVTVKHATTFSLDGLGLDPRATRPKQDSSFHASADYLVFAPAIYRFGHTSAMLTADPVVLKPKPGSRVNPVAIDAEANAVFTRRVEAKLHGFLDDCATAQVLQPAGCPFGTQIDDRVTDAPHWSISEYPDVQIIPDKSGWQMPSTPATAHITVGVQSLFDGSVSTLERDVPFTISLTISVTDDTVSISVAD